MNDRVIDPFCLNHFAPMGTMTSAAAVVLASLWMVISQPLDSSQHAALMNVYDGFGSFHSHAPHSTATV